jgi:hypothetical protein
MPDSSIIISCYKKDLNWSRKLIGLSNKIYVYDHTDILNENRFMLNNINYHYERIPNKGCEGGSYLKYIIDNYYNLPEKIILIHDEEYSWHHNDSIVTQIINNINSNNAYLNLNHHTWGSMNLNNGYIDQFRPGDNYYNLYVKLLEKYFGDIRDYGDFLNGNHGCAQFIIKRECITRNNIQLYIDLYNYCMSDNVREGHENGGYGYFLEYTWNIIFGHTTNLNKNIRGSWKDSCRILGSDDRYYYVELDNGKGNYNSAQVPKDEEELYDNIFGNLCKIKGSWKYTCHFLNLDDNYYYVELGDGQGNWNRVQIPKDEEELYDNIFGNLCKVKGSWKYTCRFLNLDDNYYYVELSDGQGNWNRVQILKDEEELYDNIFGNLYKIKGSWKYTCRFLNLDDNYYYIELGDGQGNWNKVQVPKETEYLYYNKFGELAM